MRHGHVIPNEDGSLARCGGPSLCSECKSELDGLAQGAMLQAGDSVCLGDTHAQEANNGIQVCKEFQAP